MSGQLLHDSIDPEVLLPLREALKLLPNLRTATARDDLGEAMYVASRSTSATAWIGGLEVSSAELAELFIYGHQPIPRLSPKGAALLLRLYAADALELKDPRRGKAPAEDLERYASSTPSQLKPWRAPARPVKRSCDAAVTPRKVRPDSPQTQLQRPSTPATPYTHWPWAGPPGGTIIRRM
jgi:hypothetical protein